MPVRSTKEKAKNREIARQLYLQEGLSLEEISQSIGETVKTIRAWRNNEEWDQLRDRTFKPDIKRLQKLRDNLLDRIEAQFTDNKLPHTEIGLLAKVDRIMARQEAKNRWDPGRASLVTLQILFEELQEHDPALLKQVFTHIDRIKSRIWNALHYGLE